MITCRGRRPVVEMVSLQAQRTRMVLRQIEMTHKKGVLATAALPRNLRGITHILKFLFTVLRV